MNDRPLWCEHQDCRYLTSYGWADSLTLCIGRLPKPKLHGPLYNTHRRCDSEGAEEEFNVADAYYEAIGLIMVIRDVVDNNLYNPCPDLAITDPIARLERKLKEVKKL